MPLQKKFDSYPYYDDYDENKDYYKIMFKPGVAVQARELNQLQTILQKQIERFGDHVFKSGTVISGVNFTYERQYNYVKILDVDSTGAPATPAAYVGLFARNSSNLVARIVNSRDGYQSTTTNLNTLYLSYLNSGASNNATKYSNNDVLTIYSPTNPVYKMLINSPGIGFSNSDSVIVTSAVRVLLSNSSLRFQNTETISSSSSASLEIVEVINTSNTLQQVLRVKPRNVDLANTLALPSKWTLAVQDSITGATSNAYGFIDAIYGTGAYGVATTDSLGIVRLITVASSGSGYEYAPHVTIRPSANVAADLTNLSLTATNYRAKVTVASSAYTAPVGQGYAFSVSEGVIYQKGYFSRVSPQTVIVEKYSNQPDGLVVGFVTEESNVGVTYDSSLYDNAANTTNFRAPGADRLLLTPTLRVVNSAVAEANTSFFPLVEFQAGQPSREYRDTQYNQLAQEFERRTLESAGDFVLDPFFVTTKEIAGNSTHFSVVIDPGTAYISGARIKTINNLYLPVEKVANTLTRTNSILTASYGNYVIVKELAGNFDFKTSSTVDLYDTASSALTNGGTISTAGNKIGTARLRSLVFDSGSQGQSSATYRMYLFDIQLNSGKFFQNVKSIYYNGTNKGICDVVQAAITTANRTGTPLYDNTLVDGIFDLGIKGTKSVSSVSYRYRTSNEGLTISTAGTFSITAPSTYEFPYSVSTTLTTTQKEDFSFIPLATLRSSSNATGSFNVSTTSASVPTSTSQVGLIDAGDFIGFYSDSSNFVSKRVLSVNSSVIVVDSNVSFTNTAANAHIVFPANVPIDFSKSTRTIATRSGVGGSATVDVSLGRSLISSQSVVGYYTIYVPAATKVSKAVNRNVVVKINTGTHSANSKGPWSLGLPDVLRLRGVYDVTSGNTNVTKHFYIDDGGRGDSYKLASLVKRPTSSFNTVSKNLLVRFDCYTPSSGLEGFFTVSSYAVDDTKSLNDSSITVNTLEIPEVYTSKGRYYDLRDCFDFRPVGVSTATLTSNAALASENPSSTFTLNSDEKYFPAPGSDITYNSEVYQSRADTVVVRKDGTFDVLEGTVKENALETDAPKKEPQSLLLNKLIVPKYPSLPRVLSSTTQTIADKKVGNDRGPFSRRRNQYVITTTLDEQEGEFTQPPGYTMAQIGKLERRIEVLEQYASLTLKENAVKNISIASSVDPSKQRFKNGFIVDSFDANTSADVASKEFNATIYTASGVLMPASKLRNLPLKFNTSNTATSAALVNGATLMLPFTETSIISFAVGTVPYVPPPVSTAPVVTPSPSISVAPSRTPVVSNTPIPSRTPGASPTPAPSLTPAATPAPTPSITPTASPTPPPSLTPGATPTPSPTITPTPSPSRTPGASPTPSPSLTPPPSPSPTSSPLASATPTPSPTRTPASTPTPTPSRTPIPSPSVSMAASPAPSPSGSRLFAPITVPTTTTTVSTVAVPTVIPTTTTVPVTTSGGSGGSGCPDPEMMMLMADGTVKKAGEIQVGDMIHTMHEVTGSFGSFAVSYCAVETQDKVQINFTDGTSIVTSDTHRFLMDSGMWEHVYDIATGAVIRGIHTTKEVASIDPLGPGPVVKLTVEDAHTYIVEGLLSHNSKYRGYTRILKSENSGDFGVYIESSSSVLA